MGDGIMVKIWFRSDDHLDDEDIIHFWNRPFQDIHEMTEKLRTTHNLLVAPQDHVYFMGDVGMNYSGLTGAKAVAFITELKRWHGHKRLLLGNHDEFPTRVYLEAGFEKIYSSRRIGTFIASHIPIHPGSISSASANVHGHLHGNPSPEPHVYEELEQTRVKPFINLSLEMTDYRPVELDQVEAMIVRAREDYLNAKLVTGNTA